MFVVGARERRQDAFGFEARENCRKRSVENATPLPRMRLPSRGISLTADGPPAENGAAACSVRRPEAATRRPSSLSECV